MFSVFIIPYFTFFAWDILKLFMHCSFLSMIITKAYFNLWYNGSFNHVLKYG